jgi:hypothetical protein
MSFRCAGNPAGVQERDATRQYFRRWPRSEEPAQLLRPENQCSTPWGEPNHGPCDKCDGAGTVPYSCASCVERGAEPDCPACHGRVSYTATCPTCEGDGRISRHAREGVSVFSSIEGLYHYLAERGGNGDDCVVLELEGELTDDIDLDADAGALLVRPTRIVRTHPFDDELFESKRGREAA